MIAFAYICFYKDANGRTVSHGKTQKSACCNLVLKQLVYKKEPLFQEVALCEDFELQIILV
jgi:hypothetical protein